MRFKKYFQLIIFSAILQWELKLREQQQQTVRKRESWTTYLGTQGSGFESHINYRTDLKIK